MLKCAEILITGKWRRFGVEGNSIEMSFYLNFNFICQKTRSIKFFDAFLPQFDFLPGIQFSVTKFEFCITFFALLRFDSIEKRAVLVF